MVRSSRWQAIDLTMVLTRREKGMSSNNHRSMRSRRTLWQWRKMSMNAEDHCCRASSVSQSYLVCRAALFTPIQSSLMRSTRDDGPALMRRNRRNAGTWAMRLSQRRVPERAQRGRRQAPRKYRHVLMRVDKSRVGRTAMMWFCTSTFTVVK